MHLTPSVKSTKNALQIIDLQGVMFCDPDRGRTCNLLIRNQLLYPLSYRTVALF